MSFKEWLSCQQLSKSLLSVRPFSFFYEESPDGELSNHDAADVASVEEMSNADHTSQGTGPPVCPQPVAASSYLAEYNANDRPTDPLTQVEVLQINFFRLVQRIGQSPANPVVPQVLYRLHLASLIRASETNMKRPALKVERARAIASELEAVGQSDLDFSFKILVLGKTGVGKSATINSIFGQPVVHTDAFQPATTSVQEVTGTINGIKVSVIDTPGLLPSNYNQRRNRKILFQVKRFVRRSPPDVILYFERLDIINQGCSDHHLLKLITEVFGASIWCNTILVMTHSSSFPPEGSDNYSINYDSFVSKRTNLLQYFIHQAVQNNELQIPVLLVENHPRCRRNTKGEKILPNGQVWMSQFFLLCIATKVLGDANLLLRFQDSFQVTKLRTRLPSLPHLLSSFLHPRHSSEDEFEEIYDNTEDDEYDQLPPIRILTKAQYQKLSKDQKKAYLDELYYRETLYLQKQWKAELKRKQENTNNEDDNYENDASQELVQLPDIEVPLSFESDCPNYRYRCLVGSSNKWFTRPVFDSQGWDHDVGFDGINLETSQDLNRDLKASVVGQVSKDKEECRFQLECAAKYSDQKGRLLLTGVDIQSAGKKLVSTIRGETKIRNLCWNVTGAGLALTFFEKLCIVGVKVEDSVAIGKRCKLMANAGRVGGCGQVANGGSLEVTVRGRDYPVRDDKVKIAITVLSSEKEMVLGGSLESDLRVSHTEKISLNANLNSRNMGQLCFKVNTSEHIEIGLVAVVSLLLSLFWGRSRSYAMKL